MTDVAPSSVTTEIVDIVDFPFVSVAFALITWLPFDRDGVVNVHVENPVPVFVAAEYAPPSTETLTEEIEMELDAVPVTVTVDVVNNSLLVGDVIDMAGGGGVDTFTANDVAYSSTRLLP